MVSLFFLGTTLLMSVFFRNVLASIASTVFALYAVFAGPASLINILTNPSARLSKSPDWLAMLDLSRYWGAEILWLGEGFVAVNFVVWLITTAMPLLAALWLFNRKAY